MTDAVFNWFWQPPINGADGLIMIVDQHPGPSETQVPFVAEDLKGVIHFVEARIAKDLHLWQFQIYVKDPFGLWYMVRFPHQGVRRFIVHEPDLQQGQLSELWDQRQRDLRAGVVDAPRVH